MKKQDPNDKIKYEPPRLLGFSYGSIHLVSGNSSCEMRFSHTTDCNFSISFDDESE